MAASDLIKYLSDEDFDVAVSQGLILVDFYADWCGPCRMLSPILDELANEFAGKVVIAKVDTDRAINVASNFEVTSIPTMILFKDGQVVKQIVGVKDIVFLRKMISEYL